MKNKLGGVETALVVGASSGVGLACVRNLTNMGVPNVFSASRSGADTLNAISSYLPVDVTQESSVKTLADRVLSVSESIDLLVYSAGYVLSGPIEDTSLQEAQQQFDANFWGMVRVVQAFLSAMRESGGGTIILIGSLAGMIPLPFQGYYSASKFAMEAYAEALSFEVEPLGIRVCLVQPGDLNTPFTSKRKRANSCDAHSVYFDRFDRCLRETEKFEAAGQSADSVAKAVIKLVARKRLPLRYRVSKPFEELVLLVRGLSPNPIYRFIVRSILRI